MYPTPPSTGKRKRRFSLPPPATKKQKAYVRSLIKKGGKKGKAAWLARSRRMIKKKYRSRYFPKGKTFPGSAGKSLSGLALRKKRVSKIEKQGVNVKFEYNGTYTTQESATPTYDATQFAMIGHCSSPPKQLLASLAYAIVKKMANRMGSVISSFQEAIPGLIAGDQFYLYWQANHSSAVTSTSLGAGAGNSWYTIWTLLYNVLETTVSQQAELVDFRFVPSGSSPLNNAIVDLVQAKFLLYGHSTLRLQNASLPADSADDTADEVTAVTLVGKTFVGKGCGTALVRPRTSFTQDVGLYADRDTGIIQRAYATDVQVIRDIPRAEELIRVTKSGKAVMPPGAIQQSQLKCKYYGFVTSMFRMTRNALADPNNQKAYIGSFTIHMLEKAIEPSASATVGIVLQYKVENNFQCMIESNPQVVTTKVVYEDGTVKQ